nr:cytochrome P450 26A1 isoform X1 [Microcebus murinus]XP_020136168.1 cytochrome P450 26A1 isoform X1 [Microcebus murinus]XP_020136169.1 cytochrome P450 26A1 isoform X1 [Microcebus murinus]
MGLPALLASALCTFVLPLLLFLAAIKLWDLYCVSSRDRSCALPLPPGTMGFPFFGETLQMVLQRRKFLQMKRRKYGFIYKTHLFGRPTVRVMGADNVRRILLGEHRLVSVHWPASVRTILGSGCLSNLHDSSHKQRKKVIMRAFSREALQCYVPVIAEEVGGCLERWLSCDERGLLVYPEVKRLMFRIAMRILLGCEPRLAGSRDAEQQLVEAFEEMTRNLFSLPIDVPFSGLYRVRAARRMRSEGRGNGRLLTAARSLRSGHEGAEPHSRAHRGEHSRQDLPAAGGRVGRGLQRRAAAVDRALVGEGREAGHAGTKAIFNRTPLWRTRNHGQCSHISDHLPGALSTCSPESQRGAEEQEPWRFSDRFYFPGFVCPRGLLCKSNQDNKLDIEILEQLKYIGCVIKETLRLNPPVPGGFRVALKTFELNGYQIPKGWNVIYSICDTHDVADIFTNKEEFNPDRFLLPHPEDASRFSFIPFGGGLRSCVGKEFAKILLKIFTVELARHCDWQLLNGPPTMKTSPTVYPVDNLPARFTRFQGEI